MRTDTATEQRRATHFERRIAEAIAGEVVELVRSELRAEQASVEWIDAKEVARRFGVSRAWVYANAGRLGAVKLGDGARPRLRFDARNVAQRLRVDQADRPPQEPRGGSTSTVPIHVPEVRARRPRRQ